MCGVAVGLGEVVEAEDVEGILVRWLQISIVRFERFRLYCNVGVNVKCSTDKYVLCGTWIGA